MSVTFSPDTAAFPRVFGVTCFERDGGEALIGAAASYEGGLEVRALHMAECSECAAYGCFVTSREVGVEVPEVNMSNFNAKDVLAALGVVGEEWYCGSMTVADIDARILMAEAVGTAGDALPMVQVGNSVHCGREEGYIAHKIGRIRAVVEFAREHGVEVTWG